MADGTGIDISGFFDPYQAAEVDLPTDLPLPQTSPHVNDINLVDSLGTLTELTPTKPAQQSFDVYCLAYLGNDWFEFTHVVPRRFDFGNILGTITRTIDIFNASVNTDVIWSTFTNNVGIGMDITDLPILPQTIKGLGGLSLTLEVTTEGAPQFNTTLDFVFSSGAVQVPVTGQRVIMFPYTPEAPFQETFEFLTDILLKQDGSEQRIALRKNPRQIFDMEFIREEGEEYSRIEFLLYDWQGRSIGLPMWHESTTVTSAIATDDTTINVDSTDYADYRLNGLAIILNSTDDRLFDALEIDSLTSTTITFKSGASQDFPIGSRVFPIRIAQFQPRISAQKQPVGYGQYRMRFKVIDNDSDLADSSAFSTYDSKILLDGFNYIEGPMSVTYEMKQIILDNSTGNTEIQTPWLRHKHSSTKGFYTGSRQQLWVLRQLLHALKGQQLSFWLPTFHNAVELTADLSISTSVLQMKNVGYSDFVKSRNNRNIIRVTKNDGTKTIRTVISSSEVDVQTEQLTINTPWTSTILESDIKAIDFYELVRLDSDSITLKHRNSFGEASTIIPVKAVFE